MNVKNRTFISHLSFALIFSTQTFADTQCFIAQEDGQIISQEGNCTSRFSPCSTFKIPLSLMGYDSNILQDETHPTWSFKQGYVDHLDIWKQPQNPKSWMQNSCVWYSQILTPKIGIPAFKEYVVKFNYGNKDVTGDVGQNNGLTQSWLSSSLEISPEEQIAFLQKLVNNELPVSAKAHAMTQKILYVEDLPHGWKLYGKTGSGSLLSHDRKTKLDIKHGWFVGWIQKDDRILLFAKHITDDKKQDTYAGLRAKADTKERLVQMIEDQLEMNKS